MVDRDAPGKLELLLRLSEQQMAFSDAFLKGNQEKSRKNLDAADTWLSRFDRDVSSYLETAAAFRRYHDQSFDVTSVINTWLNGLSIHADVLQSKGDLEGAERLRARQLEISETYLEEAGKAEVERGRAAALIGQGRFNEALTALMAARDYFQRHGDDLKQARVTIDMVDLLQWLGDYERAATQLNQASETVEGRLQGGAPTKADMLGSLFAGLSDIATGRGDGQQAVNLVELYRIATELNYYKGLIARALGDYETAKHQFDKVMPEYVKMGVGPAIEFQLGACELGEGDAAAAYRRLSALEKTFLEGGLLRQKLAGLMRVEGEALIELGRTEEALDKLRAGIVDLETYYDPDLLWRLQWQEGRALQVLGQDQNALAAFEAAADTVDSLRKAPLGHRLDSTYLEDKLPLFSSAIALACQLGEGARCARLIELIKSRALTATMSLGSERPAASTLDSQIDALTRELDSLEFMGFQEGDAQKYRAKRQGLLAERAELIERTRATNPLWRSLTEPVAFDLDAIQSVLRLRGQAALTLYLDGDALTAVLVTGSAVDVACTQLTASTLDRLRSYADSIEASEGDSLLADLSQALAVGARHLIPKPLLDSALSQDALVVIPHGFLHLVPWAGLIHQGKRLFQYCPVGVLPNLSCLLTLEAPMPGTPALAVIGAPDYGDKGVGGLSPLPEAEREIESVSAHYRAKGRLIDEAKTGPRATESAFWDLVAHEEARHAVLHVVCHGVPEPFEPLNAGLLLADAKIDAAEISRSRVPFDEIVLSACSTGWRPVKVAGVALRGDDILGLPGGFLEAGARSILVSIPKANDKATATFMSWYHAHRTEGKTPLAALQQTQKQMLECDTFKPFMWIGITAYGCQ